MESSPQIKLCTKRSTVASARVGGGKGREVQVEKNRKEKVEVKDKSDRYEQAVKLNS